jgi:hypothetical protein
MNSAFIQRNLPSIYESVLVAILSHSRTLSGHPEKIVRIYRRMVCVQRTPHQSMAGAVPAVTE